MRVNYGKVRYGKLLREAHANGTDPLEDLNKATQDFKGRGNIASINGFFRYIDSSWKAPIFGRFDATERAIRSLRKERADGLCVDDGYAYILALNEKISDIVNSAY